jgi:type I restriction enzyme S subunit
MSKSVAQITTSHHFKPYPEYKDSGVDWLGKIPAHWEIKRLKHLAMLNPEALPEDTDPTLEMVYVDIGGVSSLGRIVESEPLTFAAAPSRARRLVRDGDVIVSTVRTYLRAIAPISDPEPGMIVSTGFAVVRPEDGLTTGYAGYALRTPYFVERVVANSKGVSFPAINESEMATYELAVPPEPEQHGIAAFLDRKTAKIDALVVKNERLIELLQEKRTALITQAVTKGLNPTVPMKDSGVDWLGQIPAHWEVKRIRDIAESLQTGPFGSQLHADEYVPGGCPVINPANLQDGQLVPDWDCTVDEATARRLEHHRLAVDDILLARRGELGRCGLTTQQQKGWVCGTGSLRIRTRRDLARPRFLTHLLSTSGVRDWLQLQSVGSTMQNLNTSIIGRITVALAIPAEQDEIVARIDCETGRVDSLIAKVRNAIARLKELRTALISAAVTGIIDIRGEAA